MHKAEYVACADALARIIAARKKAAEQAAAVPELGSVSSHVERRTLDLSQEEAEARLKLRKAHAAFEAHKGEAHPYTPFPIDRISEAAVGAVRRAFYTENGELKDDVDENEAALLSHGSNVIVGPMLARRRRCRSETGSGNSKAALLRQRRTTRSRRTAVSMLR